MALKSMSGAPTDKRALRGRSEMRSAPGPAGKKATRGHRACGGRRGGNEASERRGRGGVEAGQRCSQEGALEVPAPAPKEPMQGVWRLGHLPAPAHKEPMQGVWGREHLPAPAPKEQMQGVWGRGKETRADGRRRRRSRRQLQLQGEVAEIALRQVPPRVLFSCRGECSL